MIRAWRQLVLLLALGAGLLAAGIAPADEPADSRQRAQIHTELGAAYFGRGQLGVALEELNTALKADAGYAPAYSVLGLVYMALREDDKADENFRRSLGLDGANSDTHNNYGWFLCQRGRIDDSLGHFMAALKNPLYATPDKAYLNAGLCLRRKNDDRGAEDYFLKSLKLQPQQSLALFNLADIYYKRGNYGEARNFIARLARIAAPSAESLWLAVRTAHKLGDRDAEASNGLQLRKMYPNSPEAQALHSGKYD